MIERNLYSLGKSKSDDVYLTPYKWSATERRLLQVESKNLEEAQDVYYENWCGNLDVKKQFKNSKDEYSELEAFLEYEGDFDITEINSDLRFNISSEDYFELERIFRFKTVEKKNAQEEVA